ncbi:MAG: VOC family protein [Proteobacteria bacterium]|nr:VOC family protein [Pseudomonadota bacterium]
MHSVKELGYIVIEASNLDAWRTFAVDALGLMPGEHSAQCLGLRLDERAHRMIIEAGPADDMAAIGYDCRDDATLAAIAAQLGAQGHAVADGGDELARRRKVRRVLVSHDPDGNRVELYVDLAMAATPFQSASIPAGFVTGAGGAGHAFLPTGARQPMLDYYALLGFRLSDYIQQEIAPGMVVDAAFTHCNPRHHTLAFAALPSPKKMHHFMIEARDRVDVGRAYDRVQNAKVPLALSIGMHPNDLMFSFYVTTPSGFAIELGADGRLILDDDSWQVVTYDCLSTWGHRPVAPAA